MTQTNKNNNKPEKNQEPFNDHPLITYSNRIQKHLLNLTHELSNTTQILQPEKRKLLLIIANLPPQAKQTLKKETQQLEDDKIMTTKEYRKIYGTISDWIYTNILQASFKINPLNQQTPHLGTTNEEA